MFFPDSLTGQSSNPKDRRLRTNPDLRSVLNQAPPPAQEGGVINSCFPSCQILVDQDHIPNQNTPDRVILQAFSFCRLQMPDMRFVAAGQESS
jgi:hypothetical protein